MLAVNLIDGSNNSEQLTGSDGADEINGRAGDDILIGGQGSDILVGGLGADQFVIDFLSKPPDKIFDFHPEHGDTLILRFPELSRSARNAGTLSVTRNGTLRIRLLDQKDFDVVNLYRSNLAFDVKDTGKELRLRLSTEF